MIKCVFRPSVPKLSDKGNTAEMLFGTARHLLAFVLIKNINRSFVAQYLMKC